MSNSERKWLCRDGAGRREWKQSLAHSSLYQLSCQVFIGRMLTVGNCFAYRGRLTGSDIGLPQNGMEKNIEFLCKFPLLPVALSWPQPSRCFARQWVRSSGNVGPLGDCMNASGCSVPSKNFFKAVRKSHFGSFVLLSFVPHYPSCHWSRWQGLAYSLMSTWMWNHGSWQTMSPRADAAELEENLVFGKCGNDLSSLA